MARRIAAGLVPALRHTAQCSSCGRAKVEGVHLVAGPGVYLCDRCLQLAARQLTPRRPAADAVQCRFCRQLRAEADVTAVGGVAVCADCLGLMETMLAEATLPSRPAT